jgi:hypothetical protein
MASPVAAPSPLSTQRPQSGAQSDAEKIVWGLRPLGFALFRHGKGMSDARYQQLTL